MYKQNAFRIGSGVGFYCADRKPQLVDSIRASEANQTASNKSQGVFFKLWDLINDEELQRDCCARNEYEIKLC